MWPACFPKAGSKKSAPSLPKPISRLFPARPFCPAKRRDVTHIERGRVDADTVMQRLSWLYKLYRTDFLELAAEARGEPIDAADDDRYGVVLNVQRGTTMRFECHVDSNPVTGILFRPHHPDGGELVVSHDPDAVGVYELDRDGTPISPEAGQIIIFDGAYPHYARYLPGESDVRVVAVMNFDTGSCPESTRPPELNRHRFGDA